MGKWNRILNQVLGDKTSMKEKKLIKRAIGFAKESPSFAADSTTELETSLRSFLDAKGSKYGFSLEGGRVIKSERGAAPAPPAETEQPAPEDYQEKKKRKKHKQQLSPEERHEQQGDENEEKDRPLKKHKKSKSHHTVGDQVDNEKEKEKPVVVDTDYAMELMERAKELPTWRVSQSSREVKSGFFSSAEEETIKKAVHGYAILNGFSTTDFSWVVARKGKRQQGRRETLGVWRTIAAALPKRNIKSTMMAAVRIFHPHARRREKWTSDEDKELLELAKLKERKWAEIGEILRRTNFACQLRYRWLTDEERKKRGAWSEEEDEKLRQIVKEYLEAKAQAEAEDAAVTGIDPGEQIDRRHILDGVNWAVVSQRMGDRSTTQCFLRWYNKLCPSMIDRGDWGAGDDRRMLRAMWKLKPEEEYEVPWGKIVEGRTSKQTRRRWQLMVKLIPDNRDKEFYDRLKHLVTKWFSHWLKKYPENDSEEAPKADDGSDVEEEDAEEREKEKEGPFDSPPPAPAPAPAVFDKEDEIEMEEVKQEERVKKRKHKKKHKKEKEEKLKKKKKKHKREKE